jgi:outer membrane protein assembly factor BamB
MPMKRSGWPWGAILALLLGGGGDAGSAGAGWPQFEGPSRDGVAAGSGPVAPWGSEGPKVVWRVPGGEGYSGLAVADGRVFTLYAREADEWIVALGAADGRELWRVRSDVKLLTANGNGPRSTPTVDGATVFAVGARGKLFALDVADGRILWRRDLEREFKVARPHWGTASSPLVEGERLIVQVGGRRDAAFAAFDKRSGEVLWAAHSEVPAYASPVAMTLAGRRQVLFFGAEALVSVAPEDGELLWRYPWVTPNGVNVATPLLIPPDRVFISSAYDIGAALLAVQAEAGRWRVEPVWAGRVMKNLFHTSVFHRGHLYGFDNAILKCIEAATGRERWRMGGYARGSVILAGSRLIVLGEHGRLALVDAEPAGYRERARAQVLAGRTFTGPALADGRLYLRDEEEIVCLELAPARQAAVAADRAERR